MTFLETWDALIAAFVFDEAGNSALLVLPEDALWAASLRLPWP